MKSDIITDQSHYRRGWVSGLPETPCGCGSTISRTKKQSEWLPKIIDRYGIRTLADIGAGDLNWISRIDLGCEYQPLDLVPRHKSVKAFNVLEDCVPRVDAVMCLWVLNHFPHDMARIALDNILAAKPKHLIMTWDHNLPAFLDMPAIEAIEIRSGVEIRLIKC